MNKLHYKNYTKRKVRKYHVAYTHQNIDGSTGFGSATFLVKGKPDIRSLEKDITKKQGYKTTAVTNVIETA